jgi:5-dehydro-4-deoxyglucarate dehydratase
MNELKDRLRGVLAFPVTPYDETGQVNLTAVRSNADWLAAYPFAAVVAPSGTGELFSLTPDECASVTAATVEAIAGRIAVIAGVGFGPTVAARLARDAELAGADAVLVMPPYYATPDGGGLIAYYAAVAEATTLPIIPYARDAASFTTTLVVEMAEQVPSFVAYKDGRGDVRLFQRLREAVIERLGADRLVWLAGVGDDLVGPYFAAGAEGFTSSLACFWPEASLELWRLAHAGDIGALRRYHNAVVRPIYGLRARRAGFEVAVMKAAMEIIGLPAGPVRPPLANLSATDRSDLESVLAGLQVPRSGAQEATVR